MKGFIEFFDMSREEYVLLNVNQIILVKPGTDHGRRPRRHNGDGEGHVLVDRDHVTIKGGFLLFTEADRQAPDTRDSGYAEVYVTTPCALAPDGCLIPHYGHGSKYGETIPYREVVEMIRDATKEEKEEAPTPPKRKRRNGGDNQNACAREGESFVKPTVEDVAAYVREKGYAFDAEEFWNFYESNGWRVGRSPMKSWKSACVTWQKKREQDERSEAARTAHIDAKMAEREKNRAAAASRTTRRRPDNWIGCSDAERKEFIDGLA